MALLKLDLCDECFTKAIAGGAAHGANMFSDVWDTPPEITIKGGVITLRGTSHTKKRTVTIRVKVHSPAPRKTKPKLKEVKSA